MTERELLNVAENRLENLLLAETAQLVTFVRNDFNGTDLKCAVVAELVARWCLSGDGELGNVLSGIIGKSVWRSFVDWYNVERLWTDTHFLPNGHNAWRDPTDLPGLEEVLRRRLTRLFTADGFIPVFNPEGVWFLPFTLDPSVDGAVWNGGDVIAAWSDPVRRALSGTESSGIRIQLWNGPELSASVTGNSLMLPVWMAVQRNKALPKYDILRVLSTGAFDDSFTLSDVEVRPKFEAMKRQFRNAIMFAPNVPGEIGQNERNFYPLDDGLDEQEILQRIREGMERSSGVVSMSRDYALRRLPDMHANVDRENHNRWNEVAAQLEGLNESIDCFRDPEKWLEFSSLLATALCHAGRTEDSRACTREASAFAREHGFAAKALRLQVTAAVNAQDMGEMDNYKTLSDGLAEELESFTGPEKDDLLMRFHGTAAQAHAFGTVYGIAGFSCAEAKDHAEKALKAAYAIADLTDSSKRDEAESNVAQDLNYRHLILALFEPGSADEDEAFVRAQRQLKELSRGSRLNNRYHQMRQKSLAYFNAWRNSADVPSEDKRNEVRLPAGDAEGWLVAANRRHLGALAAAVGDAEEAKRCFDEGEKALPLNKCWAPVLGSIRFALLVQAACSLHERATTIAASYYQKADEVIARFGESKLFRLMNADRWMSLGRSGTDPRNLPQFYY